MRMGRPTEPPIKTPLKGAACVNISKSDWEKIYEAAGLSSLCSLDLLWRNLRSLGLALPDLNLGGTIERHIGISGWLPSDERYHQIAMAACNNRFAGVEKVVSDIRDSAQHRQKPVAP